jgi:hypothetical protein
MVEANMTLDQEIKALDNNIESAKESIEFGSAVGKLRSNRDFKQVILEGYFKAEAIRLVHLKADPNMQSPEKQQSIVSQMDAIGAFMQYLDTAMHMAALATRTKEESEELRSELAGGALQ